MEAVLFGRLQVDVGFLHLLIVVFLYLCEAFAASRHNLRVQVSDHLLLLGLGPNDDNLEVIFEEQSYFQGSEMVQI